VEASREFTQCESCGWNQQIGTLAAAEKVFTTKGTGNCRSTTSSVDARDEGGSGDTGLRNARGLHAAGEDEHPALSSVENQSPLRKPGGAASEKQSGAAKGAVANGDKASGCPLERACEEDQDFELASKMQAAHKASANPLKRVREEDKDLELAKKLQAPCDREHSVLETWESNKEETQHSNPSQRRQAATAKKVKTRKISSFFDAPK